MEEELERQYGYLWNGSDRGWVLLKASNLLGGYCVFHKVNRVVLLIESDAINAAVCKRMKDAGCEVLEDMPPGNPEVKAVAL